MAFLWTMSLWVKIGFLGQALFTARFLVQWLASEKKRSSVMPVAFWWLSLAGGSILLVYAIHREDAVFVAGQATGLLVYTRNLMLVAKSKKRTSKRATKEAAGPSVEEAGGVPKPHRIDVAAPARRVPWT